MEQKTCKYCGFVVYDNFYFCPNCGKKLKDAPLSTSFSKQLGVYALSFLLPPLGLVPAFKYLKQKEPKAKIIGIIAISLTIISILLTLQLLFSILNAPIGGSAVQLQELKNLGY